MPDAPGSPLLSCAYPDLTSTDAHLHLVRSHVAAMENLISLVNKLQWACTVLDNHGEDSVPRRTTLQLP
jgi:hypothetical protein